jgi:hypothetical protein
VDKAKLIEEIELFGKLDIKYVLEELFGATSTNVESVTLDSERLESIIKALTFLIEHDKKFAKRFEKAFSKVEKLNKVADSELSEALINPKDIKRLYELLQKAQQSSSINSIVDIHKIQETINQLSTNFITKSHNHSITINGDNSGVVVSGDNNTIQTHNGSGDNVNGDKINAHNYFENINNDGTINVINHNEIDFEQKLQAELDKLSIGNMIFNTPKEMFFDETKEVTLRISRDTIMVNDLPIENQTITQEIKISSFMKATLKSNDFDIMALNSEEQIIDGSTATEWKWDITPKLQKAESTIYLTITVRIPLSENKEVKKDIPVYKRKIRILLK